MTRLTAFVTLAIVLIAIAFGIFAPMLDSQDTVKYDGITYAQTSDGLTVYKDVEYIHTIAIAQPAPINVMTPAALPDTSAPHGMNICTLTDQSGNTFDVNTDQSCDTLQ